MSVMKVKSNLLSSKDIKLSVKTYAGSVAYLKRLVPIAITNIIFNRVDFDDDSSLFTAHTMNETAYKTLSSKISRKHQLFKVYHWMDDALLMLQKKYLKDLLLILCDNDSKRVIEHYTISITYSPGDTSNLPTGQDVVDATAKFFQDVNTLGEYDKLAASKLNFAIQIVLNDDTPDDFVTPNFEKGQLLQPAQNGRVLVGMINTGFHKLKIKAEGDVFLIENDDENADNEIIVTEDVPLESNQSEPITNAATAKVSDLNKSKLTLKRSNSFEELVDSEMLPEVSEEGSQNLDIPELSDIQDSVVSPSDISCMCSIGCNFKSIETIRCTVCKKYQHVACLGLKYKTQSEHTCFTCCEKIGRKTTDLRSKGKTDKQKCFLARTRLIGLFMSMSGNSPEYIFAKIDPDKRGKVVTALVHIGIVQRNGKRIVAAEGFEEALKKYIYQQPNCEGIQLDSESIADSEECFQPTKKQKVAS